MRPLAILIAFIGGLTPIGATTLQQLRLDEMAQKSTAIARVRVTRAEGVVRGGDVYTVYQLETLENLKTSAGGPAMEVATPGGTAGRVREVVAGAPSLRVGAEYVLFLWTGRSGLTQIIGLSQGVFSVNANSGEVLVTRAAAGERMLDAAGQPVRDTDVTMPLSQLRAQVRAALRTSVAHVPAGVR